MRSQDYGALDDVGQFPALPGQSCSMRNCITSGEALIFLASRLNCCKKWWARRGYPNSIARGRKIGMT